MSTVMTALRPLTAPEKLAVELAARGVPEYVITYRTRLDAAQIATAQARHEKWERLGWGLAYTAAAAPSTPPPPAPAGPDPHERAVQLHAGGMGINQVAVATGLTRAEVLATLGLDVDERPGLLPAGDVPPVLQGIDGSIAGSRPSVIAKPKTPVTQPRRQPIGRRPVDARPWEDQARGIAERTRVTRAMNQALQRRTTETAAGESLGEPPTVPATTAPPIPAVGSRAWKRLGASDVVRAWAIADGWTVPPPGRRLPGAIVRAYINAHPDHRSES